MKKSIALLSIILTICLLCACGGKQQEEIPTTQLETIEFETETTTEKETVNPADIEGKTMTHAPSLSIYYKPIDGWLDVPMGGHISFYYGISSEEEILGGPKTSFSLQLMEGDITDDAIKFHSAGPNKVGMDYEYNYDQVEYSINGIDCVATISHPFSTAYVILYPITDGKYFSVMANDYDIINSYEVRELLESLVIVED